MLVESIVYCTWGARRALAPCLEGVARRMILGSTLIWTRRNLVHRLLTLLVIGLLLLASAGDLVSAAEVARHQPLAPEGISAKAAFVVDTTTGAELFALHADTPLPPASLTKVAAALVILDEANLEDRVEILESDLVGPDESQVGLIAGDELRVRDLLLGVLIPSGNDATNALARYIGTNRLGATASPDEAIAEFVSLMNAKAQQLGAKTAHFALPTGVDAEGHVMSARDVAILTAAALKNPLFAEIVNMREAVLESKVRPEGYAVSSTNLLLQEGIVQGVKTGTTEAAGGCLVSTFTVGPNRIVAVVLGSALSQSAEGVQDNSARFADTRALIAATSTDYAWINPREPGAVEGLADELAAWDVDLVDALVPVPASEASNVRYRLFLDPPSEPGEVVGEVQFYIDDTLLAAQDAVQAV